MGGVITLLFITALISGAAFVFEFCDILRKKKPYSLKVTIISFIILIASLPLLFLSINKYSKSQKGEEVARYSQSEYDLDKIFIEYYTRQELHEGGFYYKFEIEFDAADDESIEIRKGSGDYNDNIIIIYHKHPQQNSFLDPFNLEDYRR